MASLDVASKALVVGELEDFFVKQNKESAADVVSTLVDVDPAASANEKIAGIPAADVLQVAQPILDWFVALAAAFAVEVQKDLAIDGAKTLAGRFVGWLRSRGETKKRPRRAINVSDKVATIGQIAKTLEEAGWSKDQVEGAAQDLWERGMKVGRKLADAKA